MPKITPDAGTDLPEIAEQVASPVAFLTRAVSPLLVAIGMPDNLLEAGNPKHEWLEEFLLPNATLVNGAQDSSETTIEVTAGTGTRFVVGDVVQPDGSRELMKVTTANANDIVVTRAAFGTTGEAIADATTIKRIHRAAIENEDAFANRNVNRERFTNFLQIFKGTAAVSDTMRASTLLGGVEDELEQQIMDVKLDLMRDIALAVINGRQEGSNPEGNDTQARTMDGIIQSILKGVSSDDPSVVDAQGASLDEALINTGLRDSWEKGGGPDLMASGPAQKRALSALMEGRERFGPGDSVLGIVAGRFESDFGALDVLEADIFVPNDAVLLIDSTKMDLVKMGSEGDPFREAPLARTGTADRVEVIAEVGLQPKNARDGGHVLIQNLATS